MRKETFGKEMSASMQPNSPRYTMRPKFDTDQYNARANGKQTDQPGPGKYNTSMSLGTQVSSNRTSVPSFSFGTMERHHPEIDPKKTVYIGKDYEKQSWGE